MALERAEWQDVQTVLRETFRIWTPGLLKSDYYFYTWCQLRHHWSRRNYQFMVFRQSGKLAGSLKFYGMDASVRGKQLRFAGLGAVYTMESHRGQGYGKKLMAAAINYAKKNGFDALYLFSDIGTDFYERFDFREMGGHEFWIYLPDSQANPSVLEAAGGQSTLDLLKEEVFPVEQKHASELARHHRRWLRRQPYGIERSPEYWNYKLFRELFLHKHSLWSWPRLELVVESVDRAGGGYALVEQGQKVLRVLEVIGDEEATRKLWSKLIALALFRGCTRIRGWEGLTPSFLGKIQLAQRSWGVPMLLPLRPLVEHLADFHPCGLLELDHL
jgi:predicted acetyltransferase